MGYKKHKKSKGKSSQNKSSTSVNTLYESDTFTVVESLTISFLKLSTNNAGYTYITLTNLATICRVAR